MYGYFSYHPTFPSLNTFAPEACFPRFAYPKVDTKIFAHSIQTFRPLLEQGSKLLDRLAEPSFALQMKAAAQEGKNEQVDQLVKSIGLKVPVTTHYTPSSVVFTLHSQPSEHAPVSCCSLSVSLKWGH